MNDTVDNGNLNNQGSKVPFGVNFIRKGPTGLEEALGAKKAVPNSVRNLYIFAYNKKRIQ
jgi:hypothetical protein